MDFDDFFMLVLISLIGLPFLVVSFSIIFWGDDLSSSRKGIKSFEMASDH